MSALPILDVEGAVVTYLLGTDARGEVVALGEFPHCAPWYRMDATRCPRDIVLTDLDGSERKQCTRNVGHTGPHVEHFQPGLPLVAWLEKP